jgi:hypothetical protein
MEVQAHTHTPRKNWTHYLWEFIMLFLAVFCGFLAENLREHQVEKQRGKQYIRSFYEDLKTDTVSFLRLIRANEIKTAAFVNLFRCYDTIRKNWRSTSCLIPIIKYSRFNTTVAFADGTLQQLKNAGGYRLLHDEDRDSIMSYDKSAQSYKNFETTVFQETQDIVRSTSSQIGDFESNKFLYPTLAGADSSDTEIPLVFSDDKVLLNKYFNDLFRYKAVTIGQTGQVTIRLQKAENLLAYFKKKYHFE